VNKPTQQKVLVVDPDPAMRALIVAVLRREGYSAEIAETADAALDLRRTSEHAAVVLDPHVRGGEALLERLQHEAADANVNVNLIVMTTTDEFEPEYVEAAGVRAVLIKPFMIEDLANVIASCCVRE